VKVIPGNGILFLANTFCSCGQRVKSTKRGRITTNWEASLGRGVTNLRSPVNKWSSGRFSDKILISAFLATGLLAACNGYWATCCMQTMPLPHYLFGFRAPVTLHAWNLVLASKPQAVTLANLTQLRSE